MSDPMSTDDADRIPLKRALVSVYDKTGLEDLVRGLHDAGVALVSTGGSAALIEGLGLPVTRVEDLTGFPECLDGRVKTLHPRVHAGILADRRLESHVAQLADLEVEPFDLVVCNLYPFSADRRLRGARPTSASSRSTSAGRRWCVPPPRTTRRWPSPPRPTTYADVLRAAAEGGFTLGERQRLAAAAFAHTAAYDVQVAEWFAQELSFDEEAGWPDFAGLALTRAAVLRYGENPHQRAALYVDGDQGDSLATAEQLHGKAMSYNNYVDTDAALRAAHEHGDVPTVAIIKHANPCGLAVGADVAEAHRKAHECDPVSAFGGVIATNVPVTVAMAEQVAEVFTEVIVAPAYDDGAVEVLQGKKNIRILRTSGHGGVGLEFRQICGGVLVQMADDLDADGDDPASWTLAAGEPGRRGHPA